MRIARLKKKLVYSKKLMQEIRRRVSRHNQKYDEGFTVKEARAIVRKGFEQSPNFKYEDKVQDGINRLAETLKNRNDALGEIWNHKKNDHWDSYLKDGMFIGDSHAEGGIKVSIVETGDIVEVEGDEYLICKEAMNSTEVYKFKRATNKQVLSFFHKEYCPGDNDMNIGDFVVCKLVVNDTRKRNFSGTVKQIINKMQKEKQCKVTSDCDWNPETDSCEYACGGGVMEAGGDIKDNIRHYKNESLSTDSVYYRFFDDKGRQALIRLSDHDPSFFRQQADLEFPLDFMSEKEIIEAGKNLIKSKPIPNLVFYGDEIDGYVIIRINDSGYGRRVTLRPKNVGHHHKDIHPPLASFEEQHNVKVEARTREEENMRNKYGLLYQQLKDKELYIHRISNIPSIKKGIEEVKEYIENYKTGKWEVDSEYKTLEETITQLKNTIQERELNLKKAYEVVNSPKSYPVLITGLYKERESKLKEYSPENEHFGNIFYLSENEETRWKPDFVDFHMPTHDLIPYLDYLVDKGVLSDVEISDNIMAEGGTVGGFEIERETAKALLLSKDGVTFWIQKRWLRNDGTLTPKGNKSYEDAKKEQTQVEEVNERQDFEIKKETDKAYLLRSGKVEFWVPKSWYEDGFLNAKGLINYQKAKEIYRNYRLWESPSGDMYRAYPKDSDGYIQISTKERSPRGYYENHRYAKGERGFYVFFIRRYGWNPSDSEYRQIIEDIEKSNWDYSHIDVVDMDVKEGKISKHPDKPNNNTITEGLEGLRVLLEVSSESEKKSIVEAIEGLTILNDMKNV